MSVVLDTNVFVAGIFWSGPPYEILNAWQESRVELVISPDILDEYIRVAEELSDKYPDVDVMPFIELVMIGATIYSPPPLEEPITDDPDDDKFFAAAIASRSSCIVSGDRHLLTASGYGGVDVMRPANFVITYL